MNRRKRLKLWQSFELCQRDKKPWLELEESAQAPQTLAKL
jgi:hypothetical protein